MPIFFKQTNIKYDLILWKITEREKFINLNLSENSIYKLSLLKKDIHKKQFLASRKILELLKIEDKYISYNNGKPFVLNTDYNISISHSGDFCAVIKSKMDIGIDIETKFNKIVRIKEKFLSENEKKIFFTEVDFIRSWCTKESIYKLLNTKKSIREIELNSNFIYNDNIKTDTIENKEFYVCISYKK